MKYMNKLFLALCFITFNSIAGEWKYIDGWVYVNDTNDSTAGGAILEKKKVNKEEKYNTINGERYITTEERKAMGTINTNSSWQMKVIDTPQGKNIYIPIPIDCKLIGLDKIGLKTPEPNTNGLLFIGFSFLLLMRSLSRKEIKI